MWKRFSKYPVALALAALALIASPALAPAQENGGLHYKDWFAATFKDIAEDIATAAEQDKRLVLIVEQTGCVYCKQMHETVLVDPEVVAYLKQNFMIVQLDMWGAEEITDLDGEVLTEKQAIRRWGLLFTPTILFLPDEIPEGGTAAEAAVAAMPGAFGKGTFLDMFTWVREKGYETDEPFQRYHIRKIEERQAAGGDSG